MILLDTCAIVWDALEPTRLSRKAKAAIGEGDANKTLFVADISLWEIAMLIAKGRIVVAAPAEAFIKLWLRSRNAAVVPISPEIAAMAAGFGTEVGSDPADRLVAASTIVHKARLVTADANLRKSRVLTSVW